jgi:hypothetical protein
MTIKTLNHQYILENESHEVLYLNNHIATFKTFLAVEFIKEMIEELGSLKQYTWGRLWII